MLPNSNNYTTLNSKQFEMVQRWINGTFTPEEKNKMEETKKLFEKLMKKTKVVWV